MIHASDNQAQVSQGNEYLEFVFYREKSNQDYFRYDADDGLQFKSFFFTYKSSRTTTY